MDSGSNELPTDGCLNDGWMDGWMKSDSREGTIEVGKPRGHGAMVFETTAEHMISAFVGSPGSSSVGGDDQDTASWDQGLREPFHITVE